MRKLERILKASARGLVVELRSSRRPPPPRPAKRLKGQYRQF
jgi:hypothetical protein